MTLPPYAELLGLAIAPDADGDTPVLTMAFGSHVVGRPGFLHGGAIGGLLEMTAYVTLHQALADPAVRIKPINVTFDFMRGGRDKPTHARASIARLGTRIANLEAIAWQDDPAHPIAAARLNYLLVRS